MKYYCTISHARIIGTAVIVTAILVAGTSRANTFTTSVDQQNPISSETWNDAIWQPGQVSAVAGNTYEILDGHVIGNPSRDGVQTFPGDSLIVDAGAIIEARGPVGTSLDFPGVAGNAGLVFDGGTLRAGDDHTFRISGRIYVATDSIIDHGSDDRNFVITAQIDGDGNLTLIDGNVGRPLEVRSTNNTYRGTWLISSGYLRGTADGSLGSGNIVIYEGARFTVNYDIQTPGTLTLLSSNSLMFLHQDCQFGAAMINDTSLSPGTYSYDQLIAQFPGNFAPGGSGSITVSPPNDPSDAGDDLRNSSDIISSATQRNEVSLIPPDPPASIIVSASSSSEITIHWSSSTVPSGIDLGGYDIYRNGAYIASTGATTYYDSGLSPATQYCYTIVAFDVLGNSSAPSAEGCAMTQSGIDIIAPSTPSGLLVLANSASQVTLYWNRPEDLGGSGVAGYRIYRNGALTGSTIATEYTDTSLQPSTEYCYSVIAFDFAGNNSSGSAPACATMPGSTIASPSNLSATAIDANHVNLVWTDNSNNEVGFRIERASSAYGWKLVGTVGANVTSFTDSGLDAATTYYYRVSAFN